MKIFVKTLAGKTVTVKVDPSDTVNIVKAKIQDQERLIFGEEEPDDMRTLADYDIQDEYVLYLDLPRCQRRKTMHIFVKGLRGKTSAIRVEDTNTVESFKAKIEKIEDAPASEQRLLFGGKQLEDGHILKDYGITPEATLHLVLRL